MAGARPTHNATKEQVRMERTEQEQPEPTPAQPQPNPIYREPATVEACQQDYADGADIRQRLGWKSGS